MRHVKLPTPVLHVAGKCLRTWWKIRKPTTFGVKVLLIHPDDPAQCLIVRHSYSDSAWWGMPGGGYRPGRETPEHAGVREVSEELALTVAEAPTVLDTVSTTLEGKRETLTIVQATSASAAFVRSPEIAEARWVRADMAAMPEGEPVSRWLSTASIARLVVEATRWSEAARFVAVARRRMPRMNSARRHTNSASPSGPPPMSDTARLALGTCPDSRGVWFADDPLQTPWERFLDEVAEVGYEWLELGPYGYLPTDPGSPARVHQHLDIGQGDVDWDVFFRTVAEVEFDGIAAVCVFAWEERARESSVFNLEQIRQYLAKHPGPAA